MAGIVTTSSGTGAGSRLYRMAFTTTSTSHAINWISGTTSSGTGLADILDKGCEVTFQNQSTGAVNVYIGGPEVGVALSSTSTAGTLSGIQIAQNGTYAIGKRTAVSAIQMAQYYCTTTSSAAVVVAHLIHAV